MSLFNALPFPAINAELPEAVERALQQLNGPLRDSNNTQYALAKPLGRARYPACPSCGITFNLFRRKNNCVNCGQVVCADCIDKKWYLPKYGLKSPVSCCTMCDRNLRMSIKGKQELESCSIRELRAYLQLYGLYNATAMIEKGDLVAAIYNNSPMPQVNEDKYRALLPQPSSGGSQASQQRQQQQQQQHNRSRSTDADGAAGSWDRMFTSIGDDIGRGIGSLRDGLAEAFESMPSSSAHGRYQHVPQYQDMPQPPPPPRQNNGQGGFNGYSGGTPQHASNTYSHSSSRNQQRPRQQFQQSSPRPQSAQSAPRTTAANTSQSGSRSRTPAAGQAAPDVPDLKELVRSGASAGSLGIKALKGLLAKNHVDYSNIVEKQELVQRVERLIANAKLEMDQELAAETAAAERNTTPSSGGSGSGGGSNGVDDNLCKICWDASTNIVFTPCGHLCTCLECAEKIMKLDRRECPICRDYIKDYIRVFRA